MPRMNWLVTSKPSSEPRYGTANQRARLPETKALAAGNNGERVAKIILNSATEASTCGSRLF
jgi:hypothetical protein